jgi:hypothetical protein
MELWNSTSFTIVPWRTEFYLNLCIVLTLFIIIITCRYIGTSGSFCCLTSCNLVGTNWTWYWLELSTITIVARWARIYLARCCIGNTLSTTTCISFHVSLGRGCWVAKTTSITSKADCRSSRWEPANTTIYWCWQTNIRTVITCIALRAWSWEAKSSCCISRISTTWAVSTKRANHWLF